jgi:hypothetical protein
MGDRTFGAQRMQPRGPQRSRYGGKHVRSNVSVVIAAYNCEQFLADTIASAQAQTLPADEILVVDDASTDATAAIVGRLAARDRRVSLISLAENAGPSHARNVALDRATGRWVAILDGDDLCAPHRLEQQVRFLHDTGVDLCGSWFTEFGQGPARTVRWPHEEAALATAMLFQSTICHPTVMARREVFDAVRYREDYRLAEDYDLFVRAGTHFRLANVPEALLRYRRHTGQATQAKREQMETVTRQIRLRALEARGIAASREEQRIHNLIRAPTSIHRIDDLVQIEAWLTKLLERFPEQAGQRVIASQWTRAAVRAAPLGRRMWQRYRASRLHALLPKRLAGDVDLAVLAMLRLDYASGAFRLLRRLGLSA